MPRYEVDQNYSRLRNIVRMQFLYFNLVYYYYYFLNPVLNSQGMKKLRYAIQKKYKNQAGMNLTPPPPSQNSHAVRCHCTAESERRVAEIKS